VKFELYKPINFIELANSMNYSHTFHDALPWNVNLHETFVFGALCRWMRQFLAPESRQINDTDRQWEYRYWTFRSMELIWMMWWYIDVGWGLLVVENWRKLIKQFRHQEWSQRLKSIEISSRSGWRIRWRTMLEADLFWRRGSTYVLVQGHEKC